MSISNVTTATVRIEENMHWIWNSVTHFDTWCGATCHTLLRYILRSLLILALVGTFATILMRTLDPKRRAELKRRTGLDSASSLLGRSDLSSVAGHAGMSAKTGSESTELSDPDVKDSCTMM